MKAKLMRYTHSGQFSVQVTFPNGDKLDLWEMIVEYCAKDFSNNELAEIYRQCNNQLKKMDSNDIPQKFHEMMNALTEAIVNRKCYELIVRG